MGRAGPKDRHVYVIKMYRETPVTERVKQSLRLEDKVSSTAWS